MSAVVRPPLHVWQRHHPAANAIAGELLSAPALLELRTRRLERDIRDRYHVAPCTARIAVAIARRTANKSGDSRGTKLCQEQG